MPPRVETLEEQVRRAYDAYRAKDSDLERHIYLRQLQDTSQILFYRLLLDHIEEMTPVVYTPVVAQACRHFSQIYRRPRGLFVSYPMRGRIRAILRNRPYPSVDVIVVTDGERVLGIGDQGVGGMGIPIGKLALYSLIGGVRPERTLPIFLDVGTNNPELLSDPRYLGWRHERVEGRRYFDFVDEFVSAVKAELPGVLLQWEDFAAPHARPLLERTRDELLTFNDDIQGTAAVALGAVLSAVRAAGTRLRDQKIVILGAGSAGTGVADTLRAAMATDGLSQDQARERFWLVDKDGLLTEARKGLSPAQRLYARRSGRGGLAQVIQSIDASVLIGLSTVGGAFTERIVREMSRKTARPIIFPLSNPTSSAEASPQDLLRWTRGKALVATGSPFPSVAQCNNVYVFPAVGLAATAAKIRRVTDGMMLAAARALAELSPGTPLLPRLAQVRHAARAVAFAVASQAQKEGVAPQTSPAALRRAIAGAQWAPAYRS